MDEVMTTAMSTAFSTIKDDTISGIATALPYALAVGGIVIAIRVVWGFFKSAAR